MTQLGMKGLVLIVEVVIVGVGEDFEHGFRGRHLERAGQAFVCTRLIVRLNNLKTSGQIGAICPKRRLRA